MLDIEFNVTMEDESGEIPLMDSYETAAMLESTEAQIRHHLENRLGEMVCEEHGQAPKVIVTGAYSQESEQLDIQYSLDTCCKMLLLRAVAALNR